MFCITLESNDPFFNLAIEEVLLKNSNEEFLILGINRACVIIGKHQTPHREINTRFITENKIPVIRRISGGGTVYHDPGNLNFSFIKECEPGKQVDFFKYTKPVIDFLAIDGVDAKLEGKNDLKIDGLKISGNAEHVYRNRILHHGTLLFSTSLGMLRNSLRKDTSSYTTRAVASNPSSVTNISENLTCYKDIFEFRSRMMNHFLDNIPEAETYELNKHEIATADALAVSKYRSWEWNWAYGPDYQYANQFELAGKQVFLKLNVKDGIITECKFEGSPESSIIEERIIGRKHMVEDLRELFREENIINSEEAIYNFF